MAYHNGPKIITHGLTIHLDTASNRCYPGTGSTLTDLSNSGNNCTLNNSPVLSGGRVIFNGVNQSITIPDTTLNRAGGAVSCWVKVYDFSSFTVGKTVNSRILVNSTSIDTSKLIALYEGGFGYETNTNSDPLDIASDTTPNYSASEITAGSWFNFTLSFSANIGYCYVNGKLNRADNVANSMSINRIGDIANVANYPDYMKGEIGSFMIYNRGLTPLEVKQNYNAMKGRYGLS